MEDPVDLTRAHVGDEEIPLVPKPAELLHQQLLGVPGPAHLPEIEALGGGRDGDPADFRPLGVHHAHPEPGDGLADPRESDLPELGIGGIGGDEHGPHPHPGGVGLDEGDAVAVGAPHGAAVGDGLGGGVGQAGRMSRREVVDVKVAITAEEDAASFRGDGAPGARLHPTGSTLTPRVPKARSRFPRGRGCGRSGRPPPSRSRGLPRCPRTSVARSSRPDRPRGNSA